jgi:hypothetical protein
MNNISQKNNAVLWNSPVPEARWRGRRDRHKGAAAFASKNIFEEAQQSELQESLSLPERQTLHRLLQRGQKAELELFTRTHGANPLFDPNADLNLPVGLVKADPVILETPPSEEACRSILNGEVVHVFFQAGEASRFNQGPFYGFSPMEFAADKDNAEWEGLLNSIHTASRSLPSDVAAFLTQGPLGPKQTFLIRAALRRVVQQEIQIGRITVEQAQPLYQQALSKQKLLFFVSQQNGVAAAHDQALRNQYRFFGFDPMNVVTIEQDIIRGLSVDERGDVELVDHELACDAAGHLYALLQAVRPGDFTVYSESGRPLKSQEVEALGYLAGRGGRYLNIIRINDMDRHTTEIINAKAFSYALAKFRQGVQNVIECVSNPSGQKGGTGLTFGDLPFHFLTETHESSFPTMSRAVEAAFQAYKQTNEGQHPAYNAMRQWADLQVTRRALIEAGGRLVFVPRQKEVDGGILSYIGVDMPMGDLSLLAHVYPSRMFQLVNHKGQELCIHDMKLQEHLSLALKAILFQVNDPHVLNAARESLLDETISFSSSLPDPRPYAALAPELE